MTEESEPGLKSSYPHFKSDASREKEKALHVSFDAVKEMHSPRFRAILRVTSGRRKRAPPDVKSFSHELNSKLPPGLPFHKFRGLRNPEDIMTVIRSKFNRLKEEINSELGVYAGDLVSILEKTTEEHPDWRVPLEDLLVIAQKCAEMSSDEFWLKCEGIVQNLDDRRQDLPMGSLKQAHTRILFILTRCTRLLQFQKEGIFGENDHILGRHQFSDLGFYPEQITPGDASQGLKSTFSSKAIKDKLIRKKLLEHGLSSEYFNQDFAGHPLRYSAGTDSPESRDRISSWKKLPSAVEKNKKISYNRKDELLETKKLDSLTQLDKRKLHPDEAVERPSETLDSSTDPGLKIQQASIDDSGGLQGLSDVKPTMICRVCDFEIPTLYAEGHFKVCTIADKCDSKGLSIDERLDKVAEILEKLLESCLPRSSDIVAVNNGDARVSTSSTRDISDDLTPLCSNLNHLSSTDKLDCFSEADSPHTTRHNGLLSITCNRSYLTTFDKAAVPPSSGSITPRSPLLVPQTSQIDSLLAGISAYSDLENLQQIKTLLNILRCIMGVQSNDYSSLENLSSYLEDLNALIEERNVDALVVETFGRRIEKLLQEKFVHLCGQIDDGNIEASNITVDEDGTMENDMSRNSRPLSTKLKDRTSIEDFEIIKPISRGAFGRVFLAKKRITGDLFAIKVLKKADMIRKNAVESILAERNILISVRNPFVVRFYYSFTCRENLYLVMEYLNGGDLYSLLRNLGCLDEEMARTYIAEVVLALEYLHSLNVIHRDLKPDNLLIARDGHIKLTDFGLSKVGLINSTDDLTGPDVSIGVLLSDNEPMPASLRAEKREQRRKQTAIGTPDYLAPEILLGMTHGQTADWWSVGVILFELLVGIPPFNAEHPQKIFDNIMNRDIPCPNVPEEIGYDAYDLIDKLLIQNPLQRLGATGAGEVKSHPFFKDVNWDMLARQKAAFIPSTECEDDTSYFACRHTWNPADEQIHGPPKDFDDMTDTGSLSCSSSPHSSDEDEDDDECVSMADFGAPSYVENYSFSNFSFKNLSQLAYINYDIMTKCSKDEPNASNS